MNLFSNHQNYFNADGVEIPSTTTILKILNKPKLQQWSNYIGLRGENIDDTLNYYSNIGTKAHKYIEDYLNNIFRFSYPYKESVDKHAYIAFRNFITYNNKMKDKLKVIKTECKLTTNDFGGTIDLYCNVNGKYRIIDFKTSNKIHSTMFLQLAAYTILLESNGYKVDEVCILALNKYKFNTYNLKIMQRNELDKYIETFKLLKSVFYQWYFINKDDWKENIL